MRPTWWTISCSAVRRLDQVAGSEWLTVWLIRAGGVGWLLINADTHRNPLWLMLMPYCSVIGVKLHFQAIKCRVTEAVPYLGISELFPTNLLWVGIAVYLGVSGKASRWIGPVSVCSKCHCWSKNCIFIKLFTSLEVFPTLDIQLQRP